MGEHERVGLAQGSGGQLSFGSDQVTHRSVCAHGLAGLAGGPDLGHLADLERETATHVAIANEREAIAQVLATAGLGPTVDAAPLVRAQ